MKTETLEAFASLFAKTLRLFPKFLDLMELNTKAEH